MLLLPAPKSPRLDSAVGGGEGLPLPGGDALVMLSPGSEGNLWRGRERESGLAATPWRPVLRLRRDVAGTTLLDEVNDNRHPDDPLAVAFELGRWEDDWRHRRGEPAAEGEPTVSAAVGYLAGARLSWAGSHHPAFSEFDSEVWSMYRAVESAASASTRPDMGVPCFDCAGAKLQRQFGEEHYECPRCHRVYLSQEYWLAVRAELEREVMG